MKTVIAIAVLALTATVGCSSQREVDDLKAQVATLKAQHDGERADRDLAKYQAEVARTVCRQTAEDKYNESWHLNGTPIAGKPGVRNFDERVLESIKRNQVTADEDCQRQYRDSLAAVKETR